MRSPDGAKRNPGTVSPADRLIAGCTVAINVVFQFPVAPGLWWHSFAAAQSGSRQFGETVAPQVFECQVCLWREANMTASAADVGFREHL